MPELQKYCDKRAMNGYGSAFLYKESTETLYHLVLPLETAPSVTGSVDTFDFDLLTCPSKGQVEGKESLDQKDVDFLWHRDNVARLESLQGRVLDFMVVYQDFTARTFSGTIKVRPQDADADIMRGTFTITPLSASATTILDARDLIQDTIMFTNAIPSNVTIVGDEEKEIILSVNPSAYVNGTENVKIEISADDLDESNAHTILSEMTVAEKKDANSKGTGSATFTIARKTGVTGTKFALIEIKATKAGLASWTTSIAVELRDK